MRQTWIRMIDWTAMPLLSWNPGTQEPLATLQHTPETPGNVVPATPLSATSHTLRRLKPTWSEDTIIPRSARKNGEEKELDKLSGVRGRPG